MSDKLRIAEEALASIATGEIAGEPRNYRDTIQIMRDIAREALVSVDAKYAEWFAARQVPHD